MYTIDFFLEIKDSKDISLRKMSFQIFPHIKGFIHKNDTMINCGRSRLRDPRNYHVIAALLSKIKRIIFGMLQDHAINKLQFVLWNKCYHYQTTISVVICCIKNQRDHDSWTALAKMEIIGTRRILIFINWGSWRHHGKFRSHGRKMSNQISDATKGVEKWMIPYQRIEREREREREREEFGFERWIEKMNH